MAHKSTLIGGVSESIAEALFLKNGFSVFKPIVPEAYDLIVSTQDEFKKATTHTVQVKTMSQRHDREGQLVVYGANSNKIPYKKDVVDYILGIHLPTSTGYLIENNEQLEYWSQNFDIARAKWTELKLN